MLIKTKLKTKVVLLKAFDYLIAPNYSDFGNFAWFQQITPLIEAGDALKAYEGQEYCLDYFKANKIKSEVA